MHTEASITSPQHPRTLRIAAACMAMLLPLFLLNNYLVHWRNWPPFAQFIDTPSLHGWIQLTLYAGALAAVARWVWQHPRPLGIDAALYSRIAGYVIRAAFWGVLLIGVVDVIISVLRVEGALQSVVGAKLATQLGRPTFRGLFVHCPLLVAAIIIARYVRGMDFFWLALLVVIAEFQVVISRFVFSYEQAFMGDLVRFWYAALFLFAAAYTLVHEGHVRVDVLYANFTRRQKALTNAGGAVLLGLPLCWTILLQGMSGKGASITGPLLGFEISQSGYGMYVKYLMAGFLLIFAVSMALQFLAALLNGAADLWGDGDDDVGDDDVRDDVGEDDVASDGVG